MSYDNILDKFELESSRAKVKVTLVTLRKKTTSSIWPLHLRTDFSFTFTQLSVMTISWQKIEYKYSRAKVKVTVTIFRKNIVLILSTSFMGLF